MDAHRRGSNSNSNSNNNNNNNNQHGRTPSMPNKSPGVTATQYQTGKDVGKITVSYRRTNGRRSDATVIGPASATPSTVTVTPQGTPATTTYGYRVSAVDSAGNETPASTTVTTTTGAATLTGVNFNRITWSAFRGATSYKVYGRTSGSELLMATVNAPTTTYDDTGTATPAGALPAAAPAGSLNLWLPSYRAARFRVTLATTEKQTHVYYYRSV